LPTDKPSDWPSREEVDRTTHSCAANWIARFARAAAPIRRASTIDGDVGSGGRAQVDARGNAGVHVAAASGREEDSGGAGAGVEDAASEVAPGGDSSGSRDAGLQRRTGDEFGWTTSLRRTKCGAGLRDRQLQRDEPGLHVVRGGRRIFGAIPLGQRSMGVEEKRGRAASGFLAARGKSLAISHDVWGDGVPIRPVMEPRDERSPRSCAQTFPKSRGLTAEPSDCISPNIVRYSRDFPRAARKPDAARPLFLHAHASLSQRDGSEYPPASTNNMKSRFVTL